jgi:hypothetical protein
MKYADEITQLTAHSWYENIDIVIADAIACPQTSFFVGVFSMKGLRATKLSSTATPVSLTVGCDESDD